MHLLRLTKAVAWAQLDYCSEVIIPDLRPIIRSWLKTYRIGIHTFTATHNVEIQRDLGLLFHPTWWNISKLVIFFNKVLDASIDPWLTEHLNKIFTHIIFTGFKPHNVSLIKTYSG